MATTMQYAFEMAGERWPVYPLLMPARWDGAHHQLCTPLVRGVRLAVPHVAPAHVVGVPGAGDVQTVFLREDRIAALGTCVEQMMATAFHNLRQRPASWELLTPRIAICNDDYFAAEKICHPAFLCEAAALLGAQRGLVAVAPARGQLVVTSMDACISDPAHVRAFTWCAADMFRQARAEAISPLPIQISPDGRIVAALEIR